jgi:hypothetical protein
MTVEQDNARLLVENEDAFNQLIREINTNEHSLHPEDVAELIASNLAQLEGHVIDLRQILSDELDKLTTDMKMNITLKTDSDLPSSEKMEKLEQYQKLTNAIWAKLQEKDALSPLGNKKDEKLTALDTLRESLGHQLNRLSYDADKGQGEEKTQRAQPENEVKTSEAGLFSKLKSKAEKILHPSSSSGPKAGR